MDRPSHRPPTVGGLLPHTAQPGLGQLGHLSDAVRLDGPLMQQPKLPIHHRLMASCWSVRVD